MPPWGTRTSATATLLFIADGAVNDNNSNAPTPIANASVFMSATRPPPSSSARRVRRKAARHVVARYRAGGDIEPVPAVDRDDRQAQVCELVFGELLPDALVHVVWHMPLRDERERFSPFERGTLAC